MNKTNILGLSRDSLKTFLEKFGEPAYRGDQVFKWIQKRGVKSFDEMTDISLALRKRLFEEAELCALDMITSIKAADETEKLAFRTRDGLVIESVLIPDNSGSRLTLCVSSQAGCRMNCTFCRTAKIGFHRNLTVAEILDQAILASKAAKKGNGSGTEGNTKRITNLVFMGMGEPLANLERLIEAIRILMDDQGLNFSSRRITVSTCGLVPAMDVLGRAVSIKPAVSLNAATNEVRDMLMPINRRYPLAELIDACRKYPLARRDRITFEYVLIDGINDSVTDARELVRLLSDVKAKVNLIPFNEFKGSGFRRPPREKVEAFQKVLLDKGLAAMLRSSRGDDISAACGQLAGEIGSYSLYQE
ncbi:MAG: 23S rRNA (adenine(2503)-C(2))-methyltransferase RlmN [Deltaproteobacteria bacterium]|nr:23S rRNA (adenine(2503)-C(2))-methyltransferase RlmN [Deltaproteobacteria bacterium]